MKQFNTIVFLMCVLAFGLLSCQKELHFPEKPPVSYFTVEADGKVYNLNINKQSIVLGDPALLQMQASTPEMYVSLNFMSATHQKGIGTYALKCCSNDVYDKTSGTTQHFEIDQRGTTLGGSLTITKMDDTGYAGHYILIGKNKATGGGETKEFKGTFLVVY